MRSLLLLLPLLSLLLFIFREPEMLLFLVLLFLLRQPFASEITFLAHAAAAKTGPPPFGTETCELPVAALHQLFLLLFLSPVTPLHRRRGRMHHTSQLKPFPVY